MKLKTHSSFLLFFFFSEMEPLNGDRVAQVFTLCSELEDLFKDTTSKRKKYPQQITGGIKSILQRQKELLVRRTVAFATQFLSVPLTVYNINGDTRYS